MQWMILVLLANDPLPKELAYQLDQVRMVPAPISGALLLELASDAKISAEQKRDLAEEAYGIATAVPQREVMAYAGKAGLDLNGGVEYVWRADPVAVAVQAYLLYRDNWNEQLTKEGKRMRLSFPSRETRTRSTCETMMVSDPKGYFEKSQAAGPREFRNSQLGINSSVELGRFVDAALRGSSEDQGTAFGIVRQALIRLKDSDREFTYAMKKTKLHNGVLKWAGGLQPDPKVIFLGQYRSYLVRHFEGERCVDQADEVWKGVIEEFNQAAEGRKELLIPEEAGQAKKLAARGKEPLIFEDAAGARLLADANELSGEETELRSFLTSLEEWKAEGYSPGAAGIARVKVYLWALRRLDQHIFANRVMASFVKYLTYSPLRREMPAFWLASAEGLALWGMFNQAGRQELEYAGDAGLAGILRSGLLLKNLQKDREDARQRRKAQSGSGVWD
jgi:hypothetical protein